MPHVDRASERDAVYRTHHQVPEHFLYIAEAMTDMGEGIGLWDDRDNSSTTCHAVRAEDSMRLRSMVGPFRCRRRIVEQEVITAMARYGKIEMYRERD
jgi:hypothetical protein